MICHTMAAQVEAIEQVVKAVQLGELSQDAIEESVNRVKKLKAKYLSSGSIGSGHGSTLLKVGEPPQTTLATELYEKSTTIIRSEPGSIPRPPKPSEKIVFLSPGRTPSLGSAVDSGEEKTRDSYTPATYIDIIRAYSPHTVDIRFFDGISLAPEDGEKIADADTIILATRNASLSSYQKELGTKLGKRYGKKLVAIATCDPYDFLEQKEIKNYIAIYEPTISAFKAAIDVVFGKTKALGKLPVCSQSKAPTISAYDGSDDHINKLWVLWEEILPDWKVDRERLKQLLDSDRGKHFLHEHGLCVSYLAEPGVGKISCVGVLEEHRGKGIGTALLRKAQEALNAAAGECGLKSLSIGSVFPRFWPGVPIDFPQQEKDFFLHRGAFLLLHSFAT